MEQVLFGDGARLLNLFLPGERGSFKPLGQLIIRETILPTLLVLKLGTWFFSELYLYWPHLQASSARDLDQLSLLLRSPVSTVNKMIHLITICYPVINLPLLS